MRAGVEQDLAAVDLDERREAPFAEALVGQHRGQDRDVETLDPVPRRRRLGGGGGGGNRGSERTGRRTRRDGHFEASTTPDARAPDWRRHGRIPHAGLVDSRDACPGSGRPAARRGRGVSHAEARQSTGTVAYTFRYDRPGDDTVAVTIAPAGGVPDARALVMPRAIPMGYGEQRYDAFVTDVVAVGAAGARTPAEREEGPRWRLPAGTARVEYRVNLRQLEREVRAASDQSRVREGYLAALGYSVFAFVDGFETRPITLRVDGPQGWPVFSTLAPAVPAADQPVNATADDFYALADGQIVMGPRATVRRLTDTPAPLYLATYAEGPVDLDRVSRLAVTAFQRVADYFGTVPFPHYTMHQELLTPLTPQHEYGMSMEHLSSSTFYLAASAGLTAASTPADDARVLYNFAHHIAHAWVPKRVLRSRLLPVPVGAGAGARLDLVRRGLRPVRGDHGGGRRRPRTGGVPRRACSTAASAATWPARRRSSAVAAGRLEPRRLDPLRRGLPHRAPGVLARRADGGGHRRPHPDARPRARSRCATRCGSWWRGRRASGARSPPTSSPGSSARPLAWTRARLSPSGSGHFNEPGLGSRVPGLGKNLPRT